MATHRVERTRQLQAEINRLRTVVAKQDRKIEADEKHISILLQLIDELEREKLSIESELENLRGY